MKAWAWVNSNDRVCWKTIMPTKSGAELLWFFADNYAESLGDLRAMGYKLQKFNYTKG